MIRILTAEESLRKVTEIAIGNGLVKQHDRDRILNTWRRDANFNFQNQKRTLDSLIVPGIPLVEVKKK